MGRRQRAAADAGAVALATGSWSVAAANGFGDGEQMPRALMMDVLERITRATDLPVTVDLESGYGERPEDVAETIALSIKAGAIGCNLEDSFPATGELRDVDAAAARLAAARQAADRAGADYFINARTDVFFTAPADARRTPARRHAGPRSRVCRGRCRWAVRAGAGNRLRSFAR